MLLRVRGKGGSADNCQAITMALRGLNFTLPALASANPQDLFAHMDLKIQVDGQEGNRGPAQSAAIWREIWNSYDIIYGNGYFEKLLKCYTKRCDGEKSAPIPIVGHSLLSSTEIAEQKNGQQLGVNTVTVDERKTLVCDLALGKPHGQGADDDLPDVIQRAAWSLGYVAGSVGLFKDGPAKSIKCIRLLLDESADGDIGSDSKALEVIRLWASRFWEIVVLSSCGGGGVKEPAIEVLSQRSKTLASLSQETDILFSFVTETDESSPINPNRVPLLTDDQVSAEEMQTALEDAVVNFCPCCGTLDPSAPNYHQH